MKRRHFLHYTSLATASFAMAACGNQQKSDSALNQEAKANFGRLEKTYLTLGFLPQIECAPLAIAKERGFFSRYGLNVTLSKQLDWEELNSGLLKGDLDASQALLGMPILAQLGKKKAPMLALMMLNLNGGAITLSPKAWEANIRTSKEYVNFTEFARAYRRYIKQFEKPPKLALGSMASVHHYILRYWLSAMGLNPTQDLELVEFPPSQMIYKLQAGLVDGYSGSEPWNQQSVREEAGFIAYVNRDIWRGHPGQILATMEPWVEENPTTARALVAAILEACQFCSLPENSSTITQILSSSRYLNLGKDIIASSLSGIYDYGGFDETKRLIEIPDLNLFHFRETNYLRKPNHANYLWRSYGVWLLTQMIRWQDIDRFEYPKDADEILERIYPLKIYEEVAEALEIELPGDNLKVEPASVFIDQRQFNPSEPVAYLNSFTIRANRPQFFAFGKG